MIGVALTTVVTASVLEEFRFMKFSFELFHSPGYQWFIRCDRASEAALSEYSNVACSVFTACLPERLDRHTPEFRALMREKMAAISHAWSAGEWDAVAYFDSDLIFTAPALQHAAAIDGQAVLTPNYYPPETEHLASIHGLYQGGFAFLRSKIFHQWWRDAVDAQPERWTDQACLNDARQQFTIGTLAESANIGFWRSGDTPNYREIPADCLFLHAHLYGPSDWRDKTFALHCLKFLRKSAVPAHRILFNEILARDRSRFYAAALMSSGQ
jgi:hypothetical protein